jgi:lipopolysaccharide/colanic/teichoic acid biosynthesis glycosyltransferase
VIRRLRRHPELGLELASVIKIEPGPARQHPLDLFTGSREDREPGETSELTDELVGAIGRAAVNRVVIASSPGDMDQRSGLIRALGELNVHVDMVSADAGAIPNRGSLHFIEGLPMLTISVVRRPRSGTAMKRAFDVVVSAVGLALLSPVLLYCALRIRFGSRGPILFSHDRVGRDGRHFEMLKFRTMCHNAESLKTDLISLDSNGVGGTPGMFKISRDPRITRFGATLRRWSLDELPQLWNVLRGDMSLVGPRPLVPEEAALVHGHYQARLNARPGITGPWQTLGRSDIGLEDMVKLDYTYVTNWSFAEDLKLLARTASAVVMGRGAY